MITWQLKNTDGVLSNKDELVFCAGVAEFLPVTKNVLENNNIEFKLKTSANRSDIVNDSEYGNRFYEAILTSSGCLISKNAGKDFKHYTLLDEARAMLLNYYEKGQSIFFFFVKDEVKKKYRIVDFQNLKVRVESDDKEPFGWSYRLVEECLNDMIGRTRETEGTTGKITSVTWVGKSHYDIEE